MTTSPIVSDGERPLQPLHNHEAHGGDAVYLRECSESERIAVRTRSNVYDVIVLRGDTGEVMVRGGRKFPDFRKVVLVGSTDGCRHLTVNAIEVGLRMAFRVDHRVIVTSTVEAITCPGARQNPTARPDSFTS